MSEKPKLLTVAEAAEFLRCSAKTIRRRIGQKEIIATKPPGTRGWLIPESELKRYVNNGVK